MGVKKILRRGKNDFRGAKRVLGGEKWLSYVFSMHFRYISTSFGTRILTDFGFEPCLCPTP